jgi:2'-5' RNA ligase
MSDLTAVDIMIQPDANAIERARQVNRRMPLSIPAGITLDDTHLPHITMLQRYLITADLDQAYAAIETTIAATDVASLSYHVPGITYSEHWGPPGQAAAAFVTDPGQQISATTKDWVETYQPNQVGANYTAHLTVGLATVADLKAMQAEPFDEFDVQPIGLAVYQLGNNGTARARLKAWPLTA